MKTVRHKILLFLCITALNLFANNVSCFAYANKKNRPNLLLIGIETFRADHVSCLGYHRNTTPTLDKLAGEGVVFSRAMATSSWTIPAVMSVFTSLYPGVHETTQLDLTLPKSRTTLAQILKVNGYKTVAFVGNPILEHRYGFSRGFDLYDDFSVGLDVDFNLYENNDDTSANIHTAITNEIVTECAIKWLTQSRNEPFFMFVFYFDPHFDYVPPPPFDTIFDPDYTGEIDGRGITRAPLKNVQPPDRDLEHIIALYDGELLFADNCISRLLAKFDEYEKLDDTLVVVFGDHGDEFYEHGSTGHRHSLYNELIHIPLILRWPTAIPQDVTINALASQIDIMPTVLDYLNIEHNGFMQGCSLRPIIQGKEKQLHKAVYAQVHQGWHLSAVITDKSKLILDSDTNSRQFFDMTNDPREKTNIYSSTLSSEMRSLENYMTIFTEDNRRLVEKLSGAEPLQKVKLDNNRLRELKSMGYMQ